MNLQIRLFSKRLLMMLLPVLMLVLSACKIDLSNEVWIDKDGSGKALITAEVAFPNITEVSQDSSMTTSNVLQTFADLITASKGTKLISQNIVDNSTADECIYVYTVEFSYNNPDALNSVLADEGTTVIAIKKKNVTVYPKLFSIVSTNALTESLGEISMFEINHHLTIHTPGVIKSNKDLEPFLADKSTLHADYLIDQEWLDNDQPFLNFKYK